MEKIILHELLTCLALPMHSPLRNGTAESIEYLFFCTILYNGIKYTYNTQYTE